MKLLLALCLLAFSATAADLVLLSDGKSDYQIVVPDKLATEALTVSLNQTARLVQTAFKANGADVSVVAEGARDEAKPSVYLGDTAFARKQGVDVAKLKGWSYVQKVVGRDVIIAGREQAAPGAGARRSEWDRIGTAKGATDFVHQYNSTANGGIGRPVLVQGVPAK